MKSNIKHFYLLMIITIIGKILAFVFEVIIASRLGVGIETDSYFSVAELYTLIDSAFLGAITVVALNKYARITEEKDEIEAYKYISNLISIVFPIVVLIGIMFVIFATPLSYLVSPGSSIEARILVVRCIKVMAVLPPIISLASIGLAVLRYKRHFVITGVKSLLISVVGSIGILCFEGVGASGTDILSVSLIISNVVFCAIVLAGLRRYGNISIRLPKWDEETSSSLIMALPLMVSYGIINVSLFIDKIIVSTAGEGSVSSLTYAQSLYNCVATVFITNLCTILLTDFNQLCAKKEYATVNKKVRNTIGLVIVLLIPVTIETIVFHNDIVSLVYERGNFTTNNSMTVGAILLAYAFNFIPAMIYSVYNQVLYACGKMKQSMIIGLISLSCNAVVSLALIRPVGVSGIAIGTAISSIISAIITRNKVDRIIKPAKIKFNLSKIVSTTVLILFCGIFSTVFHFTKIPFLISFIVATVLCYVSVFFYLMYNKSEYALAVVEKIQAKLSKRA